MGRVRLKKRMEEKSTLKIFRAILIEIQVE